MKKYLVKTWRTVEQRADVAITSPVSLTRDEVIDAIAGMPPTDGITVSVEQFRPEFDRVIDEEYDIEEQAPEEKP